CLDRDAKTRFHDIADARLELDEPTAEPVPSASSMPQPARLAPWLLALVAFALAAAGWWRAMHPRPTAAAPRPAGFTISLPPTEQLPFPDLPVLDLSRDGTKLVFIVDRDGRTQLEVRARDRIESRPVAGTEGATSPFFSPDGQWIGFFADGKLKKVPFEGGVS